MLFYRFTCSLNRIGVLVIVSLCVLSIRLVGPQTLKTKRGVMRSLRNRVHNQFNVSVSEVGPVNDRRTGVIALANTGDSATYSIGELQQATRFIEREIIGKAEIVDIHTDVFDPI
ncbi:DUF503 domain-containing protein [SAR202 cluster bacterium AD-802-E10_MRT_200m]|nr:DUF503 domain-containing protein [SAR202 cluster bacterium AD-802-E10_MRT_200m]